VPAPPLSNESLRHHPFGTSSPEDVIAADVEVPTPSTGSVNSRNASITLGLAPTVLADEHRHVTA